MYASINDASSGPLKDVTKRNGGAPHDATSSAAAHIAVSRFTIGTWNLVSKYDEHILLSFYWSEQKLVWEVLHLGVVRKMEADFGDVASAVLSVGHFEEPERLVIDLARPPRFYREAQAAADGAQTTNYVYTTDFTNGQASQVSRHTLYFVPGAVAQHALAMKKAGLPLRMEGGTPAGGSAQGLDGSMRGMDAANAMAARLRKPPTSSPRLDAIILQEQLEREMRECQARYTGICPVRERMYAAAFDELIVAAARDESKRGAMLRRVRDEARMSIDNYRTVFESSIGFGSVKLTEAVDSKGDLEEQVAGLEGENHGLTAEAKHLTELCEALEHRADQKAKAYEVKNKEVTELTKERQQLEDLLAVLRLSKPDKK